jgi:hypothetical protein
MMQQTQPQQLSNFIDDFVQSGIYPGGTGIIQDIAYQLWDYDGKQAPDSVCAVHLVLQPTDGSGDNKPQDIYWSVGPSSDFQPDHTGGFVLSGSRAGMSNSSNWALVCAALKNTCGMEAGAVNGPTGIRALIGGEMTLTRKDQPARENLDRGPEAEQGGGGRNKSKPTYLSPTRFKGAWEKGGAARRPAVPGPVAVSAAAPTAHTAPAAPTTNGAVTSTGAAAILRQVLTESGGVIEFSVLAKTMLDKLVSVPPTERIAVLKAVSAANLPALAAEMGITFDGTLVAG